MAYLPYELCFCAFLKQILPLCLVIAQKYSTCLKCKDPDLSHDILKFFSLTLLASDHCDFCFYIRGNVATHIVGKPGRLNPLQGLDVCVASPEALKHFDDDDVPQ